MKGDSSPSTTNHGHLPHKTALVPCSAKKRHESFTGKRYGLSLHCDFYPRLDDKRPPQQSDIS
ncbi:hypothetical protein E2C01_079539 [Portunus trituberculatus]|uniref:Uncharacterized protein n=1 Tax=Portunus trituberculatus TaxID=210409 RepID=A0A5B7IRN8_PORTR|nr:hypothetical protein [Portunus trituberculatus]